MKPTPLSCYVLTFNSERRLHQVLLSVLDIADEIILIDSGSTDDTLQIAADFGAKVYHREFDNFRNQRVFAENQCSHSWVLALDSDEIVSPTLRGKIDTLKAENFCAHYAEPPAAFNIKRDWYLLSYAVRNFYPVRTPEYVVRIFRRDLLGHRGSRIVHEQIDVSNTAVAWIEEPLHHYSCDSLTELYSKVDLYTNLAAEDMHSMGQQSSWLKINIYPWVIWFKWHFIYGSWRDGRAGRILGKYVRDTVNLKYKKLRQLALAKS